MIIVFMQGRGVMFGSSHRQTLLVIAVVFMVGSTMLGWIVYEAFFNYPFRPVSPPSGQFFHVMSKQWSGDRYTVEGRIYLPDPPEGYEELFEKYPGASFFAHVEIRQQASEMTLPLTDPVSAPKISETEVQLSTVSYPGIPSAAARMRRPFGAQWRVGDVFFTLEARLNQNIYDTSEDMQMLSDIIEVLLEEYIPRIENRLLHQSFAS